MIQTTKQLIIVFLPIQYVQSQYVEQIRGVVSYVHTFINASACTYMHVIIYIQHTQTSFTHDILPDITPKAKRKLNNLTSNKQLNTIIILLLIKRSQVYN